VAAVLELARQQQFANLLRDSVIPPSERGIGLLMQAVARYALGDTPATVAVQIRRALDAGAPEAAAQYWLGVCRAVEGRDEEALEAWDGAREKGWPLSLVATPTAEALVRLARLPDAGRRARQALDQGVTDVELTYIATAAAIAGGRYAEAVSVVTPLLQKMPDDGEGRWLLAHALFASAVKRDGPGVTREGRARLLDTINSYLEDGGRYSTVAQEWLAYLTSSSASP
jgi:tetratricopeptide (TPR) repeat protein